MVKSTALILTLTMQFYLSCRPRNSHLTAIPAQIWRAGTQGLKNFLSLDGGHILSETRQIYRWSGRDRLALDACLSLSTSGPLCLDPSPSVHLVNNLSQSAFRTRLPKLPTKRPKSPQLVSPQPQPITSPPSPQIIDKLQGDTQR